MKIVINTCYGGFGVSKKFLDYYNIPYIDYFGTPRVKQGCFQNIRTDNRLIEFIEKFGAEAASGLFSNLKIVEIPRGTMYKIIDYDGYEDIEYKESDDWSIAT